jgi:hypothetical protein
VDLLIPARFNGPPASGNGGYTCGRVAALTGGAGTRVVLRRPPPLDRPLRVDHDGESVTVFDGEDPVATAGPASLRLDLPRRVSFEDAQRASQEYPGFRLHTFPTCFVCGPARDFAAPWTPHESLAGADGLVASEFVWASLDCPGAIAVGWPERGETVLGTLEATIRSQPLPGERCVVFAWPLGEEGRKLHAGTVLFGEDGEPHAYARAIWIAPR